MTVEYFENCPSSCRCGCALQVVELGRIAICSAPGEYLADELLKIMPAGTLPTSLKGARLEVDLGM
jgi:hypothetical protein